MPSLLDIHIRKTLDKYLKSDDFNAWLSRRLRWTIQGLEEPYKLLDRERFTATVAARIRQKARRPVYLFGFRIWRAKYPWPFCNEQAEEIVTAFLRDEKIKFGDGAFHWDDGSDLADEEMSHWERCP